MYLYRCSDYTDLSNATLVTPPFNLNTSLNYPYIIKTINDQAFIAMAVGHSEFYISYDGLNWSSQYSYGPTYYDQYRTTAVCSKNLYYVSSIYTNQYSTTSDFITWNHYPNINGYAPENYLFGRLYILNEKLLIVHNNMDSNNNIITSDPGIRMLYSYDGLIWTTLIIPYYIEISNPPYKQVEIHNSFYINNRYTFVFYAHGGKPYYNVVSEDLIDFSVNLPGSIAQSSRHIDGKYI